MKHKEYVLRQIDLINKSDITDYPFEEYADFFISWQAMPFALRWLMKTYFDSGGFEITPIGYNQEFIVIRIERSS